MEPLKKTGTYVAPPETKDLDDGDAVGVAEAVFDPVPLSELSKYLDTFDKALRNAEPMYEQIHRMGLRIKQGMPLIENLAGKDGILLLGPTGSGKSVTASALITGKENLKMDEAKRIDAINPIMYQDR